MDATRRELMAALSAAAVFPTLAAGAATAAAASRTLEEANQISLTAHEKLMGVPGLNMMGSEQIAMLLYPGFTALDYVGPYYFFASLMGATVHLVTTEADLSPVKSDLGLAIVPTITMANVPKDLDVLFVPGGSVGTINAMENPRVVGFVAERGARAKFATSVCTGSLILAVAGLLKGKRATSHWATRPYLKSFGATPVDARVVMDGKFVTGAGVSAGIDFAIALVGHLRSPRYAQALMLMAEYAPEPPFKGGTVATTEPQIAEPSREMFASVLWHVEQIAAKHKG
jgi:putative intracellular protease/amidase